MLFTITGILNIFAVKEGSQESPPFTTGPKKEYSPPFTTGPEKEYSQPSGPEESISKFAVSSWILMLRPIWLNLQIRKLWIKRLLD